MEEVDLLKTGFSLLNEIAYAATHDIDRIAWTDVGEFGVSTVVTNDCGPETAIVSPSGTHPVERYETREQSEIGHEKWVKIISDPKFAGKITELGYGDILEDSEIDLTDGEV